MTRQPLTGGLMRLVLFALLSLGASAPLRAADVQGAWFETFKDQASDDELLRFLTAMPKGGDLHNHITGAVHSEWFWDLALAAREDGYRYYTKVRIDNCRFGSNEYGRSPYLLLFRTIPELDYQALDDCERGEYVPVDGLDGDLRQHWLDALRLDQAHEGRAEFFEALWARISGMLRNPYLVADLLVRNMQAFGAERVQYLEVQIPVHGMQTPDGTDLTPEAVADLYRERLTQPDARATGVTVRFQLAVLRFAPNAEQMLDMVYRFVAAQPDFVAVNLVGREDDDKGYPLRFLETFRALRREVGDVHLSIHAGEVDEPNEHVRDTLLLGADRIGHGVNLLSDPDTLLLMRHGPYLVEINLISNLLLGYVDDYAQHPFPEYLRIGVPVALSTDDRGMWDSTLSDEFFVAVREFDLTWSEIRAMSRNSLAHAFLTDDEKQQHLERFNKRLEQFETAFQKGGLDALAAPSPQYRGFLCRRYQVCDPAAEAGGFEPD